MRILLLTDSDVFAGTERHILELAGGLRELGVETFVACPATGILAKRCAAAGISVYPVEKRGAFDFHAILTLARGLRNGQFHIVHTHNGRTAFLGAVAVSLARRGHLVTTEHFLSPAHSQLRGAKAALAGIIHRWIAWRASKVIAISQAVRRSILHRQPAEAGKVTVVLNGIKEPSAADLVPRPVLRESLGILPETSLIVTVARLEKEKGLDLLIDTMVLVAERQLGVRCIVAGEGAERPRLEQLIAEKKLAGIVSLLGFREDVLSLVAAADIFLLPSPEEPFGLALLEAMALGVPGVASRAGGPIEIVDQGQTGLLATPGDAPAFAAALLRFVQEPAWSVEAGAKAKQRYREHFSARKMATHLRDIYGNLLAENAT